MKKLIERYVVGTEAPGKKIRAMLGREITFDMTDLGLRGRTTLGEEMVYKGEMAHNGDRIELYDDGSLEVRHE